MTTDEQDIKNKVEARRAAEDAARKDEPKDDPAPPPFVRECFDAATLGDGTLFATINKGRFLCNMTADEWFYWAGHYWELDVLKERYKGVELVVGEYLKQAEELAARAQEARTKKETDLAGKLEKKRGKYLSRVRSLRGAGAKTCLEWATQCSGKLVTEGAEFDRDPWLLPCRNGVIELRTGRHRPGRPEDMLTKVAPHEWQGIDAPAPVWEKYLHDMLGGDTELISYLARAFGYAITGLTQEHVFLVLHGEGRNGKGTLVETIKYVLGTLSKPIQSELLLDQRSARSSSGPSPDIMALKGLRVAFASETDENRRFSPSKVKWLSGGDTLIGRNPHDKYETTFEPTHLLCLLTNHLPEAPGDDFAFWQRLHLVPFDIRFIDDPKKENERPRVKDLPEKLKTEAPGILAWLVRGCIEWQRRGLDPPAAVTQATEQYRVSEDLIAGFVSACCYPPEETSPETRTQYGQMYGAFVDWYTSHIGDEKYCPKKRKWGKLMAKHFKKEKTGQETWFYGVSLLPSAVPMKDY
ncbi:MAG: phage/plasmid primase, P4 family [Thermodesulfobacteriota bacterium]